MKEQLIKCIKEMLGARVELKELTKSYKLYARNEFVANDTVTGEKVYFALIQYTDYTINIEGPVTFNSEFQSINCVVCNSTDGVIKEVIEVMLLDKFNKNISKDFYNETSELGLDVMNEFVTGKFENSLLTDFSIFRKRCNKLTGDRFATIHISTTDLQNSKTMKLNVRIKSNGIVITSVKEHSGTSYELAGLLKYQEGNVIFTNLNYIYSFEPITEFCLKSLPTVLVTVEMMPLNDNISYLKLDNVNDDVPVHTSDITEEVIREIEEKVGIIDCHNIATNNIIMDSINLLSDLWSPCWYSTIEIVDKNRYIEDIDDIIVNSDKSNKVDNLIINVKDVNPELVYSLTGKVTKVTLILNSTTSETLTRLIDNMIKSNNESTGRACSGMTIYKIVSNILPEKILENALTDELVSVATFDIKTLIKASGNNLIINEDTFETGYGFDKLVKIKSLPELNLVETEMDDHSILEFGIGTIKNIKETLTIKDTEDVENKVVIKDSLESLNPNLENLHLGKPAIINSNTTYDYLKNIKSSLNVTCPNMLHGDMNILNHNLNSIEINSCMSSSINVENFSKLDNLILFNTKLSGTSTSITRLILRDKCDVSGFKLLIDPNKGYYNISIPSDEVIGAKEFIEDIEAQLKNLPKIDIDIFYDCNDIYISGNDVKSINKTR